MSYFVKSWWVLVLFTAVIVSTSISLFIKLFIIDLSASSLSVFYLEFIVLLACGVLLAFPNYDRLPEASDSDGIVENRLFSGNPGWCQFLGEGSSGDFERVFCIGGVPPTSRAYSLSREIAFSGRSVDLCDDFEASLEVIKTSPGVWTFLLIDIDHVEAELDIEDVVAELIEFRSECGSVSIALLSHSFATNDSSSVRSPISDYCFKSSVSNASIISNFPEILENHRSRVSSSQCNSAM